MKIERDVSLGGLTHPQKRRGLRGAQHKEERRAEEELVLPGVGISVISLFEGVAFTFFEALHKRALVPTRSSLPACSRPSRTLRAAEAVARRRAILDRRCARRQVVRAGRDGRMVPVEQKDGTEGRPTIIAGKKRRVFLPDFPLPLPVRCRASGKRKWEARGGRGLTLLWPLWQADCASSVVREAIALIGPDPAAGQLTPCKEVVESPPASPFADLSYAVDCSYLSISSVEAYVQAGLAPATRPAYRSDLDHFEAWGGTIPATDDKVAAYIAEHATALKVSTLTRRLAAISIAHGAKGLPNPVASPLVRATMRGIRRAHGAAQHQAKPVLREDLFVVLATMGDRLKDLRDRTLLVIGFAGGLRRSELSAINCRDIERVIDVIILTIRRSKTDREGAGRKVGIPFGRTRHCPVLALDRWLAVSGIDAGPVFRPVDRHRRRFRSAVGEAVSLILKERVAAGRHGPDRLSRPQPARRLCNQRRASRRLDAQD